MNRRTTARLLTTAALAATLALGACSSGTGSDSSSSGSSPGSQSASSDSSHRTVTDAMGTSVQVPDHPKRVVSLHYAASEAVYDVGGTLVGQGTFEKGIIPTAWEGTLGKVPVVTQGPEVKVEEVAKLQPDLILAPNTTEDDVYAQLKQIAPVYRFTLRSKDRGNWRKRVDEVADALGVKDAPAALRARFAERQKSIATKYASVIKGKKVGVVGSFEDNNVYLWGDKNMTGSILVPLGFTWSPQENAAVAGQQLPENTLSVEKLPSSLGDADVIYYDTNLRGEPNDFMKSVMGTSMWKNLPAVKAGHAFPGGKNTVAGYADASYTLDQVEASLSHLR